MSLLPNPYKPLPWPEFIKRKDICNLPIHEQKRMYLKEEFYHETFLVSQQFIQNTSLHNLYSAENQGGQPRTKNAFVFRTKAQLSSAIDEWIADPTAAGQEYGAINSWVTTEILDMSNLFLNKSTFNSNINNWDVSNVTTMNSIFEGATAFNQPLNQWDTRKVTDMDEAFLNAITFNQNISSWGLDFVLTTRSMFQNATSFNQNIGIWDVDSVQDMAFMFYGATSFDQNIGAWDMNAVADASSMFGIAGGAGAVTLSEANYQALLVGWSAQTLQSGVVFSGGKFLILW